MLLYEFAKQMMSEETGVELAKDMKNKGYKYAIYSDNPSDKFAPQFAKDTKSVSDVLMKNKANKKLQVKTIESYLKSKQKKLNEDKDKWMKGAVKHSGKLRDDLHLKKDEKVYEAGVDKIVAYAKRNAENADRVRLAWTMAKRRGTSMKQTERKFWDSVSEKMGWGDKKESRKIATQFCVENNLVMIPQTLAEKLKLKP